MSVSNNSSTRDAQRDYYTLAARKEKLASGIRALSKDESKFVFGKEIVDKDALESEAKSIFKLGEKDLIELRCLKFLNDLADTDPYLLYLKGTMGCDTRDEIAGKMAQDEIDDLVKNQRKMMINGGAGGGVEAVYKKKLVKGSEAVAKLYA